MRLIGWLVGVCFSLVLIGSGTIGYFLLVYNFLRLVFGGKEPSSEVVGKVLAYGVFTYALFLVYGVFTYALYRAARHVFLARATRFVSWPYTLLVPYSLISGVASLALAIWQARSASLLMLYLTFWVSPILSLAYMVFCEIFWKRFLEQEAAREALPSWVRERPTPWIEGAEEYFTWRYLLWTGFTKPTVWLGCWLFNITIKPKSKTLGDAKIASVDDTYKAGL